MKILCVIPARSGSKGLKNKNMRPLLGRPLVQHTIDEALKCEFFDKIVVTTDIQELLDLVSGYGERRLEAIDRDNSLCGDEVPLQPVLWDALLKTESHCSTTYDCIVLLQPTSPLLSHRHIKEAYHHFIKTKADSLLSVKEELHSIWGMDNDCVYPINYQKVCRQKVHPYYVGNGAVFISKRWVLEELKDRLGGKIELYPMSGVDSFDIHTQEDLEMAEWLKSMRCN